MNCFIHWYILLRSTMDISDRT